VKFTDEDHLYNYIADLMAEDNIDFVACPIISPWHAIGVDALVYDISQQAKRELSGIVVITPHLGDRFTISEENFACRDFAKVRFCYLDSNSRAKELTVSGQIDLAKKAFDILLALRELKRTDKKTKREMHIATALFPNVFILRAFRSKELACKYYPIFSLIDESYAIFVPERIWRISNKRIDQEKELRYFQLTRFLRVKMMYNASNLIKIIGGKCLTLEKRFLLEKSHSKLILNRQLVDLYKNILEKRGATYKIHKKGKPMAIIITDPLPQYDEATLVAESRFIETTIAILVEAGFSVVIKPHPREPIDKYNYILPKFKSGQVELIAQEVIAEILFCTLKPDCVIGYDSAALLHASIMYNIPTIRIIDILFNNIKLPYGDAPRKHFKGLTKEFLYNADTFERLNQILKTEVLSGTTNTTS